MKCSHNEHFYITSVALHPGEPHFCVIKLIIIELHQYFFATEPNRFDDNGTAFFALG